MTFRIRAIHLFSRNGDLLPRTLRFNTSGMNVITGASATGKSSLLEIIDYCLGSSGFHVAVGVIRQTVSKYAVELESEQGIYMCARDSPASGRATTTTMHIGIIDPAGPFPSVADLGSNYDLSSARSMLSSLAGIEENVTDVGDGSRTAFTVNIRHALHLVLQSQSEVASQSILFHSQNEEFIPQAIRDSLPYLLGAVDPSFLRKQELLRTIRRELADLRRRAADELGIRGPSGRALALVRESQSVGLLSGDVDSLSNDAVVQALASVLESPLDDGFSGGDERSDLLGELLSTRESLRRDLGELRTETQNLQVLLAAHTEYRGEAVEQAARLQTIGLLPRVDGGDIATCPLCESALASPIAGVDALVEQLEQLNSEIGSVRQNAPNLQRLIGENEAKVQEISQSLRANQDEVRTLLASQRQIAEVRDLAIARANVRGRISLFLESMSRQVESGFSRERLEALEAEERQLVSDLDGMDAAARVESALSRVAQHMSDIVYKLELEYAASPVRLDVRRLTVIVDRPEGPSPLTEIGSAENWLGYHLATLLGLQRFFSERGRPVPRFLFLDQPSQVYYPQDPMSDEPKNHRQDEEEDEDRIAVERFFRVLYEAAGADLQIIVTDHASPNASWFQDSIVERWRDGAKLIPAAWIDGLAGPNQPNSAGPSLGFEQLLRPARRRGRRPRRRPPGMRSRHRGTGAHRRWCRRRSATPPSPISQPTFHMASSSRCKLT